MSKNNVAARTNKKKIKDLRVAIMKGEASGLAVEFDMEEFLSSERENPFALFTEWSSDADEKAYNKLKF